MGQGPAHVLVDPGVVGVKHVVLLGQHVHGEAVLGHELVLLGCREEQHKSNQRFGCEKRFWFLRWGGGAQPAEPTPLVELVREDEALGVLQRGVFPLVSQEVAQLGGGEHAAVAGIVSEDGVEFGPPQQLPAELLDLYVVQATVSGSVAPLGGNKTHGSNKRDFISKRIHRNHIQM